MQHTSRQFLIDQCTAVANSLRSQLAEFSLIEKKGIENVEELIRMLDEDDASLAQIHAFRIEDLCLHVVKVCCGDGGFVWSAGPREDSTTQIPTRLSARSTAAR